MTSSVRRFLMASVVPALTISGLSAVPATAHAQAASPAPVTLISLAVKNVPIRQALGQIFAKVQQQWAIDPQVKGNITITITDQPLEEALRLILSQSSVPATFARENGVYVVRASPVSRVEPPAAEPKKKPSHRLRFGPEVGVYLPTNNKTRDVFGDSWINIGFGIGNLRRSDPKGSFAADFGIISTSGTRRNAYIVPLGISYYRALNKRVDVGPYVGASVDYVLTQLRSDDDGLLSRVRGGGGGSILIGTNFQERAYVQARYYQFSEIRGFDLSGLNLSAGYRF